MPAQIDQQTDPRCFTQYLDAGSAGRGSGALARGAAWLRREREETLTWGHHLGADGFQPCLSPRVPQEKDR